MGEYREKINHLHEHPLRIAYENSTRSFHELLQKNHRNIQGLTFELHKVKENLSNDPANIYLLKFNNRNTRKRCEICSKLIKAPERQMYLLLNLNIFHTFFWCFYC